MVFSHTYLLASFDSDDNHWVVSLCVGDDFKATSECRRNVHLQGEEVKRAERRGEGERGRREEEERGGGERRRRREKEKEDQKKRRSNMATNIHTRSFRATPFPEGLVKVWIVSYRADVLHIVWD